MVKQFLELLFDVFKQKGVQFVILRNYYGLPDKLRKYSDIDFLLDTSSYDQIENTITKNNKIKILKVIERAYVKETYCLYNNEQVFKLDFHCNEQWRGAIYLRDDEILKNRRTYKSFYVPSELHQSLISLFSSLLSGSFIKERYVKQIKNGINNNVETFQENFTQRIGSANVQKIIGFSRDYYDSSVIVEARSQILQNLVKYNIKNDLQGYIARFFNFVYREILLRFNPPGVIVVFHGKEWNSEKLLYSIKENMKAFFNKDYIYIISLHSPRKYKPVAWFSFFKNLFKIRNILSKNGLLLFSKDNEFTMVFFPKPDLVFSATTNQDDISSFKSNDYVKVQFEGKSTEEINKKVILRIKKYLLKKQN